MTAKKQYKAYGIKRKLALALFAGLVSGLFATLIYVNFIEPQPSFIITTVQYGGLSTHAVNICIKNNGTAAGYIHLFVGTYNSYLVNFPLSNISGSSIRVSQGFLSSTTPASVFNLYAIVQPGETDYLLFTISRFTNSSTPPYVFVRNIYSGTFLHPTIINNINYTITNSVPYCIPDSG